ncbi:MAG: restriction endonuclease [gamma proteobacterium symbiont of Taylorina sp.]|nr:restriction endonuclease [gamma proteobacterium symbiont of Taylorina sp.]
MSDASDRFEIQIKRINELIEQPGSDITWNDHIPDPDNPNQARQIDITIRRDESFTVIECRIHKKVQDVKWIEELIGRRISLQANTLIAVSASGFTKGAIRKAKKYGIILRDILTLTEQEIIAWGGKTKVSVTLFEYKKLTLTFSFDNTLKNKITIDDIELAMLNNGNDFHGIFEKMSTAIEQDNPDHEPCLIKTKLSSNILKINGLLVNNIGFNAEFLSHTKQYNVSSIVAYDSPESSVIERNTYVEQVELGNFEIMQSTDIVSVVLDLSSLLIPSNYYFKRVNFEFTRAVEMDSVYIIGLPDLGIQLSNFNIELKFE